ncbi:MAG: TonB-dependent receptor [Mailhella sp.]|nr:TonB-dependent receptor [Mailhella sp.]
MKATCFSLALCLCCSAVPHATLAADETETAAMKEIVVTASAQGAEAKRLPAQVQIVTRQELEQSGIRSVEEALVRYSPGSGASQPGAMSNVGLRGMRSGASASSVMGDRVVLLIDGMRASTGNPAVIPFAIVDHIEIVRGPSSILYGSSAMGGAVNVITKRGKDKFHGEAGASWGRFDTAKANAALSGSVSEKWGIALGGSWGKSHDYKTGSSYRYDNTASSNADLGATATYDSGQTNLHLTGVHRSVYDTGSPGSLTWLTPSDRVALHYSRLSAQMQTRTDAGHNLSASFWGEENRYKTSFSDDYMGSGNSRYTTGAVGTRLVGGYSLGDLGRISMGIDYLHSREKAHGTSVNQPDALNDLFGVFAEYRWEGEKLSSVSGVRYDNYHGSLRSNKGVNMPHRSKSYDHVSWSTGATYWITDWLGAKGSIGTAFVSPSAVNLAGNYSSGWGTYVGNPDLDAETSLTGQAGLELDWNGVHAEVMYFQTRYKNRISTAYDLARYAYTWINVPSQRLGGLDITAEWRGTFGDFTVSPYMRSEIFTKRHNPDNSTVSYVPHHSTTAGLGLGWKKLWLDVNARFTGSQWQTNPYSYALEKMGGFTVVNAKLTIHATKNLDLYCGVNNLTDRDYAFTWGYPMPGRALFGGFTIRY